MYYSSLPRKGAPLAIGLLLVCLASLPSGTVIPNGRPAPSSTSPDLTIHGTAVVDQVGWSVAAIGDLNADGHDDFAIGAPLAGYECTDMLADDWVRHAAVVDLDADGDPDMATVSSELNQLTIYLNDGHGVFSTATVTPSGGKEPNFVLDEDMDGDGDPDLVVANTFNNRLAVHLNDGSAQFTLDGTYVAGAGPTWLVSPDVDGDGDPDIVAANYITDRITTHLNDGTGALGAAISTYVAATPTRVRTANLDADGIPDVVVLCRDDDIVTVLLGAGDGTFPTSVEHATSDRPSQLDLGDFDGDADIDFAVVNKGGVQNLSLFWNDGFGAFTHGADYPGLEDSTYYCVVATDLEPDGDLDFVVGTGAATLEIRRNHGLGTFSSIEEYHLGAIPSSWARRVDKIVASDLDGEPGVDLVGVDPNSDRLYLAFNDGAGSFPGSPDQGEVYVVFGGPGFDAQGDFSVDELDGTNGFLIRGITHHDQLGYSLSGRGDVNGDGVDDLVLGAPSVDSVDFEDLGEAYVVYGRSGIGSSGSFDLSTLDGTNGSVLRGFDGMAGFDVAVVGDFDADGYDDLLVGAPMAQVGGTHDGGHAYLVRGGGEIGADGILDLSTIDGSDGIRFHGDTEHGMAGFAVGAAGDVNGDGFDDLLVTSPDDGNADEHSAAYLVFGTTFPQPATKELRTLDGMDGVRLLSFDCEDVLDGDVTGIGDFNGDGLDDFAVGLPHLYDEPPEHSRVVVVFGSASLQGPPVYDLHSVDGTNGFVAAAFDGASYSGAGISPAGDWNGDGFTDLLLGGPRNADAHYHHDFGWAIGSTYVLLGGHVVGASGVVDLNALDGTDGFEIPGSAGGDMFGRDVAFLGDVNDDGTDDLLVGAPGHTKFTEWMGRALLRFGYQTALAAFRNDSAGTNLAGYEATAPVMGEDWRATVDNTGTGNFVAGVMGFERPLELYLPGADDFLLMDPLSPGGELLGLPPAFGHGAVTFAVPIPRDPALAGFALSTQGAGLGGGGGTNLHNAYDLVIGH